MQGPPVNHVFFLTLLEKGRFNAILTNPYAAYKALILSLPEGVREEVTLPDSPHGQLTPSDFTKLKNGSRKYSAHKVVRIVPRSLSELQRARMKAHIEEHTYFQPGGQRGFPNIQQLCISRGTLMAWAKDPQVVQALRVGKDAKKYAYLFVPPSDVEAAVKVFLFMAWDDHESTYSYMSDNKLLVQGPRGGAARAAARAGLPQVTAQDTQDQGKEAEVAGSSSELAKVSSEVAARQEELSKLQDEIAALETQKASMQEHYAREQQRLGNALNVGDSELRQREDAARGRLLEAERAAQDAESVATQMTDKVASLRTTHAELEASISRLQVQHQSLADTIAAHEARARDAQLSADDAARAAQQRCAFDEQRAKEAEADATRLTQEVSALQAKLLALKTEHTIMIEAMQSDQRAASAAATDLATVRASLAEQQAALATGAKQLSDMSAVYMQLQEKAREAQAAAEQPKTDAAAQMPQELATLFRLRDEIATLQTQKDSLSASIQAGSQRLQDVQAQATQAQADTDTLLANLQQQVTTANQQSDLQVAAANQRATDAAAAAAAAVAAAQTAADGEIAAAVRRAAEALRLDTEHQRHLTSIRKQDLDQKLAKLQSDFDNQEKFLAVERAQIVTEVHQINERRLQARGECEAEIEQLQAQIAGLQAERAAAQQNLEEAEAMYVQARLLAETFPDLELQEADRQVHRHYRPSLYDLGGLKDDVDELIDTLDDETREALDRALGVLPRLEGDPDLSLLAPIVNPDNGGEDNNQGGDGQEDDDMDGGGNEQ